MAFSVFKLVIRILQFQWKVSDSIWGCAELGHQVMSESWGQTCFEPLFWLWKGQVTLSKGQWQWVVQASKSLKIFIFVTLWCINPMFDKFKQENIKKLGRQVMSRLWGQTCFSSQMWLWMIRGHMRSYHVIHFLWGKFAVASHRFSYPSLCTQTVHCDLHVWWSVTVMHLLGIWTKCLYTDSSLIQ